MSPRECSLVTGLLFGLSLTACTSDKAAGPGGSFPPPEAGYTRFTAPVVEGLPPGADVMYCQYVMAPTDHDVDILAVGGYQSSFGHHIVAFATTANVPVGTSRKCIGDDNLSGAFLGGVGGDAGSGTPLPEGVAFRLPKGSGIMLNTHFLNTGTKTIDGEGVLDVKFAEVDPGRKIAGFFTNVNMGFDLPPLQKTTSDTSCVFQKDLDFFSFGNHLHDYGTSIYTEVLRAGGNQEMVHEDPAWSYEMQFNAELSKWSVSTPLHIAKGDTLHTHCEWNNTSDVDVTFPREMCIGLGFYLSDGSPAPMCVGGAWLAGGTVQKTAVPGPACAAPGAPGNENGVGKQCTAGGNQCTGKATICLADYTTGDFGNFCTMLCSADSVCGTGASCIGSGSQPKICIPNSCVSAPDAGAGDAGVP